MRLSTSDRARLLEGAASFGVALAAVQIDAFDRYVELLLSWNDKVSLTAVTDPAAIVDKHLLDSLAVVPLVDGRRVIDVGTGPGLPSVAIAIARPDVEIVAVESIQKKVAFVRTVSRELRLPIRVEAVRLEERKAPNDFDVAVSRATFEPAEWVARGAGLVKPGGRLIAMLSAQQAVPQAPPGFTAEPIVEHAIGNAVRRLVPFRRD